MTAKYFDFCNEITNFFNKKFNSNANFIFSIKYILLLKYKFNKILIISIHYYYPSYAIWIYWELARRSSDR